MPDVVTVPGWAPPSPPMPLDVRPPLVPPLPLPGEALSTAVHSGDPYGGEAFIGAWTRVAASAEAAADVVRSAAERLPEAWDSPVSTDTVRAHLYRYADAFDDSSARARALASQAGRHGEQSAQARSDIPPPQQFSSLRQQIQTVSAANIASGGKYPSSISCWGRRPRWTPMRSTATALITPSPTRPPPATATRLRSPVTRRRICWWARTPGILVLIATR